MSHTRTYRRILIMMAIALFISACGAAAASTTVVEEHDEHEKSNESEFTFGAPGHADDTDRVIDISTNDDFTFNPGKIDVRAGETITFRIVNTGSLPHDFTIGDEVTQDDHEAEMAEMVANGEMMMHDDPNAVVLTAGEKKEITWYFPEEGSVLIGCHQPGHYAAGMIGEVTVTS